MQKTPLSILLNGLIVLSLLLPNLPAQAGTSTPEPTPTQTVEPSPTSAPLLTPSPELSPTPEPIPATPYPTPTDVVTPTDQPGPTPTPDPTPTPTPQEQSKPEFELQLSAQSHELIPGETASLFWQITGWVAESGLSLEFNLPKELSPQLETGQVFDPQTGKLAFSPSAPQGQLALSSLEDAKGPFVIQAHLRQGEASRSQASHTFREAGLNQVEKEGGTAAGLSGRVQLTFPAAAVDEPLEVRIRKPSPSHRPPFNLGGQPFEILAQGQSSGQEKHAFAQPLQLVYHYDPLLLDGPESQLRLFTFDPAVQSWQLVPSQVDPENDLLSAELPHLSLYQISAQGWDAASLPSLQSFQTDGFSGAASYSLALWTPPGPGGLQPQLALHYNSQLADNAIAGQTQASWVGMGWSLETGSIERDLHGTESTGDDTFTLQAGGVSSRLLPGTDGFYHTSDESFWRIQYDPGLDRWLAQDKVGNTYTFGGTANARAVYPAGFIDCEFDPAFTPLTWRWSLSSLSNVYAKALTYTYANETQPKNHPCDPNTTFTTTTASYPQAIQYPDSPYRIEFELEDRGDFKQAWDSPDALSFYQRSRLKKIKIFNGAQEIRSYQFSYADTAAIFPGIPWDNPSASQRHTLTLTGVQEFFSQGSSPPVSFAYSDGMHLSQGDNGYGGTASFAYDGTPWYDLTLDPQQTYAPGGGCSWDKQSQEWEPEHVFGYNGGRSWCEVNSGGNPVLHIDGGAYMDMPDWLRQPGAAYQTGFYLTNTTSIPLDAAVGLIYGGGVVIAQSLNGIAPGAHPTLSGPAILPAAASDLKLYLYCSGDCKVHSLTLYRLSTRYRVRQKILNDGVSAAPFTSSYRYDEPAMNDAAHSFWAGDAGPLYTPANRQFRGHAMSQEQAPDGRVTTTFFRQDDLLLGKPSLSLVSTAEFQDDFESGALNPADWVNTTAAAVSVERLLGDPTLKLSGDATWRGLTRSGMSLAPGESILTQFRVGAATQAVLALETGVSGGPDYRRWGIYLAGDGQLYAQVNDGTGFYNRKVLFSSVQRDAWYCLLLVAGGESFLTRVWQRDNPAVFNDYQAALSGGPNWHFVWYGKSGSLFLDGYQEGRLFSLSQPEWYSQGINTIQPGGFTDLVIQWVKLEAQQELVFEASAKWVATRQAFLYGSYGNQTRSVEQEWDPNVLGWRDLRAGMNGFYPNASGGVYLVGLPGYTNRFECPAGSYNADCISIVTYPSYLPPAWMRDSTVFLYDNQAYYTDPLTLGRPSRQRNLLRMPGAAGQSEKYRDELWSHDAWGNRTATTIYTGEGGWSAFATGEGQITNFGYDPTYHAYLLNQDGPLLPPTIWTYDYACGLPLSESGPNGAATTITAVYDSQCRLAKLVKPGDSLANPTLQMIYYDAAQPYRIDLVQRLDGAALSTQRRFYDGMGRLVQEQSAGAVLADNACSSDGDTSEDLCDVAVDTRFDAGGRALQQTVPYALPANPAAPWRGQDLFRPSSFTVYDVLGRPRQATATDSTPTTWSYTTNGSSAPDGYRYTEICQTQANGATTCTRADLLGRVRKAIPPTGPAVAYAYDIEDQLLQVQRGGATTSLSYDLGGRKLQMNDPDMGVWNYAYDALGNLTRQADARGQRICLYYDGLNRLTGKQYRTDDACPSNPTLNVTYTYDSGTYAKGYRTGMVDPSGSTSWTYDARGRVVDEMKTVSGVGFFHSAWSYNSADLPASQVFPADAAGGSGEILTFSYHPQAALKSVLSDLGYYYVQNMTYDAAGRVDLRKLGAASLGDNPTLLIDADYYLWNASNGQGRLQRLKSGTYLTPASLQDFSYAYDALGNVLSIANARAGGIQTQSFSYDALQRLISSAASGGTEGGYPLESYTYNSTTGNLSGKAGVGYTYNAAVSCLAGNRVIPHAVSAAGGNTYAYDCNGNMVQRVIAGVTYSLGYDAENRLVSVSGNGVNASFVYDGDGKRVKGTLNGVTTAYIGDYLEWSGSTPTMKKYYSAGGTRLVVRTGETLNWLLGDHLGSTNITAGGSAIEVGKLMYKPWGEERFSSGTTPTTFKFTGQRQESSFGLYLFGSRWYDPSLGRWTQPDSIVPDPYNPMDWDRYGYVLNNPLRYNDPSGHTVACPSESGNGCEGFGPARIISTNGYNTDIADETLRNFIRSHENYSFLKDPELDDTTRYLVSNAQFQVFAEESRIDSWLSSGAGLALSAMIANGGASNPGGINGASDHRAGVKYVEQLAREQFPLSEGFSYFYNRSIKSFNGGIDRRPDLTVWHGDDLVYIYEVGRTNRNGSALLPREQRKMFEYWENGLRYFFHLLKTKR